MTVGEATTSDSPAPQRLDLEARGASLDQGETLHPIPLGDPEECPTSMNVQERGWVFRTVVWVLALFRRPGVAKALKWAWWCALLGFFIWTLRNIGRVHAEYQDLGDEVMRLRHEVEAMRADLEAQRRLLTSPIGGWRRRRFAQWDDDAEDDFESILRRDEEMRGVSATSSPTSTTSTQVRMTQNGTKIAFGTCAVGRCSNSTRSSNKGPRRTSTTRRPVWRQNKTKQTTTTTTRTTRTTTTMSWLYAWNWDREITSNNAGRNYSSVGPDWPGWTSTRVPLWTRSTPRPWNIPPPYRVEGMINLEAWAKTETPDTTPYPSTTLTNTMQFISPTTVQLIEYPIFIENNTQAPPVKTFSENSSGFIVPIKITIAVVVSLTLAILSMMGFLLCRPRRPRLEDHVEEFEMDVLAPTLTRFQTVDSCLNINS